MSKFKKIILVFALFFVSINVVGQDINTPNFFSPYTIYGIGNLNTLGTAENKSMAGVGIASRNTISINTLNPAALSAVPRKTFLFNMGVQGDNMYIKSNAGRTANNTFNISDLGFQFPIAKNLGFGFLLNNYSSVGYNMVQYDTREDVIANIGDVSYIHEGNGGTSLIKAGLGYEPVKGLSIGANALFYHGNINRSNRVQITSPLFEEVYRTTEQRFITEFTKVNFDVGVQYFLRLSDKHAIAFGATYQPKLTMRSNVEKLVLANTTVGTDTVEYNSSKQNIVLPQTFGGGISFNSEKLLVEANYIYQDFKNSMSIPHNSAGIALSTYQDYRLGFSYTPNRFDVRKAMKRWTYRAGIRYGNSYLMQNNQNIKDYSVTVGLGVPLQRNGFSMANIGAEVGRRGSVKDFTIRETYFKIYLGINLFVTQEWFIRHKFK